MTDSAPPFRATASPRSGWWRTNQRVASSLIALAVVTILTSAYFTYRSSFEQIRDNIAEHLLDEVKMLAVAAWQRAAGDETLRASGLEEAFGELLSVNPDHEVWIVDENRQIIVNTRRQHLVGEDIGVLPLTHSHHDERTDEAIVLESRDLWPGWISRFDAEEAITAVAYLAPIQTHIGVSATTDEIRAEALAQLKPWLILFGLISIGALPAALLLHRHSSRLAERRIMQSDIALDALEDEARDRLATFELLFDNAPVGLVLFDKDMRYLRINAALAATRGQSPEEHRGKTLGEMAPAIEGEITPLVREVFETGEPVSATRISPRGRESQRSPKHWTMAYYPVVNQAGEVIAVGGIVQDVTDINRAREQLELIADATGSVLYSHTVNPTVITYMSPSIEQVWGLSHEEMTDNPDAWWQNVCESERDACRIGKEEWLKNPAAGPLVQEYRIKRPDGAIRWVRDHRVALCDVNGDLREVVGVATDITGARRSAQALRLITEGTTTTGQDFFGSLVTSLGRALNMRWVLVGTLRNDDSVETFAFARDGVVVDPIEYSLNGTPCEKVVRSHEACAFERGVVDRFPEDAMLQEMGAESYIGAPLISSNGDVIGLLVVMDDKPIDQTMNPQSVLPIFAARASAELERLQAESLMMESRESLLEAQRVARLGNFQWDLRTGAFTWSDSLFQLTGYSREEIQPSFDSMMSLIPEKDRPIVERQVREALAHGSEYSIDHPINAKGDITRHVLAQGQIFRNSEGDAIRLIGTIVDITERKHAETALRHAHDLLEERVVSRTRDLVQANEALHASERRMRAMFENSGAGVILMDNECRITDVNPAMLSMLHREERSLIGTSLPDLKHPDDRAACEAGTTAVRKGEQESVQHEARLLRADGAYVWTRTTLSRMPERDGVASGMLAIVEDVTQEILAKEEALQRQEELAHVSRFIALGELAAGLAHELNQPLAAVSAYADTLSRRLRADNASSNSRAMVEKIGDQARRAGEIVHRLKNLVRKRAPQREEFDLIGVLEDTVDLISNEAKSRGLTIRREMPSDTLTVQGDPVQIQQVAINLLKNAIEATPAHGAIQGSPEVDATVLLTVLESESDGIVIGVRNWCNADRQDLDPEIFDLFYSTRPQGMGLGLPISRSIIEAHGGRIWTETTDGGIWFYVSLPAPAGALHDAVGFSRIHR